MCLSGNGLFVVKDGNLSYYTRNGNFKFDKQGYYVNSDGLKVQGWSATTPGDAINTNGQPSEICIPAGKTMAASATTKATFSSNLNAAEPMIKSITITTEDGKTTTIDTNGETFKVGDPYTPAGGTASNIASLTLNMTDGTNTTETEGSFTVGYSKPKTTIATVYDSLGNSHNVVIYMTKTGADKTGSKWQM